LKIGILQTGSAPETLHPRHGDYDELFIKLLADRGFEFRNYPVLNNVFPEAIHDADGWLITGSRFGVFEYHEWIPPLEAFIRQAYSASIPIVGICFGHQIIAQALGGKVEKFSGGWSIGAVDYKVRDQARPLTALAFHQDQVTEIPREAQVLASTDFCKHAMLSYDDHALTIQPHPEFTREFLADLLEVRKSVLPPDISAAALESLDKELSSTAMADMIENFFKKKK